MARAATTTSSITRRCRLASDGTGKTGRSSPARVGSPGRLAEPGPSPEMSRFLPRGTREYLWTRACHPWTIRPRAKGGDQERGEERAPREGDGGAPAHPEPSRAI